MKGKKYRHPVALRVQSVSLDDEELWKFLEEQKTVILKIKHYPT